MRHQGFTLIEVIVVIVILGMMATFAVPRLFSQQESAVFSEGVSAVQTLYGAQQRYALDNSAFAADCASLDVSLTPKNFNLTCANVSPGVIVSAARTNGPSYTIRVTNAGVYDCPACTGTLTYLNRYLPH